MASSTQTPYQSASSSGDAAAAVDLFQIIKTNQQVASLEGSMVVCSQEHSFKESQLPTALSASPEATLYEKDQNEEFNKESWVFKNISLYSSLALFGILGVLSRYLLKKLFSPVISDHSFIYVDLLPNVVGSFLMGWFGVVFKGDISKFSPSLAVGLTTGYLGSLTTFSGWNQKMLELSVDGYWFFSMLGFLLGLFFAFGSYIVGVYTAKWFRWALNQTGLISQCGCGFSEVNNITRQHILMVVMVALLGFLWILSVVFLIKEFNDGSSTLWFGFIVGPIGVWIRSYLGRLNGKGLGRKGVMKWMPFGTLIVNVAACCIMAALATMRKDVNDKHFNIVAKGIQFGLCGCLSTVSTFIGEIGAMIEIKQYWQAFTTIVVSFSLCTLIYLVPVWTNLSHPT